MTETEIKDVCKKLGVKYDNGFFNYHNLIFGDTEIINGKIICTIMGNCDIDTPQELEEELNWTIKRFKEFMIQRTKEKIDEDFKEE